MQLIALHLHFIKLQTIKRITSATFKLNDLYNVSHDYKTKAPRGALYRSSPNLDKFFEDCVFVKNCKFSSLLSHNLPQTKKSPQNNCIS